MEFYGLNDMVRAGCQDCEGCFACCKGMGQSVILNPYDGFLLAKHLKTPLEALMGNRIELHVEEGIVLPNLLMTGEEERCVFLNEKGRCSIHPFRPGVCRLFPLGRDYGSGEIRYFLLENGCKREKRTKVKVRKWLDTEDIRKNEEFLLCWHSFLKDARKKAAEERDFAKEAALYILKTFYFTGWPEETEGFYSQFSSRIEKGRADLGI